MAEKNADVADVTTEVVAAKAYQMDQGAEGAAKVLRRRMRRKNRVADNTVVRFTSGQYTYAALFVAGMWWITGTGRHWGKNCFTDDEFTKILETCLNVQVATAWEIV